MSRERGGEGTRELFLRDARAVAGALVACACALAACGAQEPPADGGGDAGTCALELALPGEAEQVLEVPGACALAIRASEPRVVEVWAHEAIELDGARAAHHGPVRLEAGTHALALEGAATLHLRDHGPPPPEVRIERSLTWTDPALLDDRGAVGLARLMRAASSDGHGGRLLAAWLARFATTSHSERLGPQRLLDDFAAEHGADPTAWDLDRLPFTVTGAHHRVDLRDGAHCGELRVSLASTDPLHQPFHLIFLFRQPAAPADRRPDGERALRVHRAPVGAPERARRRALPRRGARAARRAPRLRSAARRRDARAPHLAVGVAAVVPGRQHRPPPRRPCSRACSTTGRSSRPPTSLASTPPAPTATRSSPGWRRTPTRSARAAPRSPRRSARRARG
ncbi:MAG: hypothetical protein M5U28_51865 [Sandaracinaceae bacterium]|nr:hypothetical protein [Sandaracinaceae bacterium]